MTSTFLKNRKIQIFGQHKNISRKLPDPPISLLNGVVAYVEMATDDGFQDRTEGWQVFRVAYNTRMYVFKK